MKIYTAEPLVPQPSPFDAESATANLKRYKLPGTDQILAEMIHKGESLHSKTHKVINSIWNKEAFPEQWKESIIVSVYKIGDKIDCSDY
jgi:hypothetical protein